MRGISRNLHKSHRILVFAYGEIPWGQTRKIFEERQLPTFNMNIPTDGHNDGIIQVIFRQVENSLWKYRAFNKGQTLEVRLKKL